jgi:CRP/FNR family transcriptional regulator, cyclic AMP receptor protein
MIALSRPGARGNCVVPVVDADPDLAARLSGPRLRLAREQLVAPVLSVASGSLSDDRLGLANPDALGLLVIDGVMARELLLSDNVSVELLGAGDLLKPCRPDDPARLLRSQVRWTILEPTRLAVLGRRFTSSLSAYPEVNAVLIDRLIERSHRVAVGQAISQLNGVDRRALALFWHLAERWGHVAAAGVELPLRLPHRIIAQLVGARRPTISTALSELTAQGEIARRPDGGWVLLGEPVGLPTVDVTRVIQLRRRRFECNHGTVARAKPVDPGDAQLQVSMHDQRSLPTTTLHAE